VGYAPADDPEIAMIIIVDEPSQGILYGSTVAAPYIASTFEAILPYLGIEPVYTEAESAMLSREVPNYVGLPVEHAVAYAESQGLAVETVGEGAYVRKQTPTGGSASAGVVTKIVLYTDDEVEAVSSVVPNVLGKTVTETNRLVINSGFNIQLEGAWNPSGTGDTVAVEQYPAAGTEVARGSVIRVVFRNVKDTE
jgi:stage V sporulation protein D (sporulation-specific penicillin-binding protein)